MGPTIAMSPSQQPHGARAELQLAVVPHPQLGYKAARESAILAETDRGHGGGRAGSLGGSA